MPDEVKHTPRPWSVQPGSSNPLIGNAEFTIAEVLDDCFPDAEQQQANANLIAAAPDLLAALLNYVENVPAFRAKLVGTSGSLARVQQESHLAAEDAALAAIAKAKAGAA